MEYKQHKQEVEEGFKFLATVDEYVLLGSNAVNLLLKDHLPWEINPTLPLEIICSQEINPPSGLIVVKTPKDFHPHSPLVINLIQERTQVNYKEFKLWVPKPEYLIVLDTLTNPGSPKKDTHIALLMHYLGSTLNYELIRNLIKTKSPEEWERIKKAIYDFSSNAQASTIE